MVASSMCPLLPALPHSTDGFFWNYRSICLLCQCIRCRMPQRVSFIAMHLLPHVACKYTHKAKTRFADAFVAISALSSAPSSTAPSTSRSFYNVGIVRRFGRMEMFRPDDSFPKSSPRTQSLCT